MSHPNPLHDVENELPEDIETECDMCDVRGTIQDNTDNTYYSSHSCPCGKYNRLMKEKFKNVSIEDLFNYGRQRVLEKKKLSHD